MPKGTLYLIPTPITNAQAVDVLPVSVINLVKELRYFFVEELRSARRFLKQIDKAFPIDDCMFAETGKHGDKLQWETIFDKIKEGHNAGILSEAGMPCVADPGSIVVLEAHHANIKVMPLVGPSSIIMALASSGLNGQNFSFNGYLPIDTVEREKRMKYMEVQTRNYSQTQIVMDTPFRNQKLFEDLLKALPDNFKLCVAANVSDENGSTQTRSIHSWKTKRTEIPKAPVLFLFGL